ncbi:MAG: SRPBCC family protein [Gammaproteobacteria bacterium]|nr:SRPBCC family protein [Gammaproteobacteria bacterium]
MALLVSSGVVTAANMQSIDVVKKSGYFTVVSNSIVKAPIDRVYEVLTDFDKLYRISSGFQDSHYLSRDADGNGVVYSKMRGCVAFICRKMERTENITVKPNWLIVAEAIPEKSDVHYAHSEWRLKSINQNTMVDFSFTFKPKFWVPPLIGTWAIKRSLKEDGEEAIQRIEKIAINPDVILDTDIKHAKRKSS